LTKLLVFRSSEALPKGKKANTIKYGNRKNIVILCFKTLFVCAKVGKKNEKANFVLIWNEFKEVECF
jgi:hypothetical protein